MEEVVDVDRALAPRPGGDDAGPQGEHRRRMVVRRVAVGDVAADGGAVAHERVRDHARGVEQNRIALRHRGGFLELRLGHQRADAKEAVPLLERVEPGNAGDIDDVRGSGEPKLHHREQALAARHHLRVVESAEQAERLVQSARRMIVELRGNHVSASFFRSSSARVSLATNS